MTQIIVMSIFCIVLIVYGYGVVFKKPWISMLTGGKAKHDEQMPLNKMRNVMGIASLVLGILGIIINVITAVVLLQGVAV